MNRRIKTSTTKSLGGRRSASSKFMMAIGTITLLAIPSIFTFKLHNKASSYYLDSRFQQEKNDAERLSSGHEIHMPRPPLKSLTGKRWAVMMIGSARSYAFARSSFIENVLHQTDPPMDVFTSTLLMNASSCLIEIHLLKLLEKDSTVLRFHQMDDKAMSEHQKTQDRFINEQTALLTLIEDYSKDHGITYDYIFYTRPDHYYTIPFNIKGVERTLEGRTSALFSPRCCKYRGWCDRLGAASYQDFSRMILSGKDWARSGGKKYSYEAAFQHRAEYANLTNFDLTPKEDYGFLTLRLSHAAQSCDGKEKVGAFWTDTFCNNFTFPDDMEITPSSCRLLNNSNSCSKWSAWNSFTDAPRKGDGS